MSTFDPFGGEGLSPEEAAVLKHVAMSKAEVIRESTAGLKVKIPDAPDIDEMVVKSSLPALPKNRDAPPLEEYVAAELEHVRRLVAAGLKNEVHRGKNRFDRAEAYARWRWQGYKDGEIKEL